ncbi:hypothetical protein CA983_27990 [Streptomyces swartbergensis]|uniref:Uncharacterized protein n=2 Tax=Streptomyces swartbergensis TaxID=487165 RepID=A0A243RW16_9ACTN|nr:hypothetical protein [Streptomyces swartbergensis]OUC99351.1 hypothetical protein CA983_27990 [Streptomyces swartbergensis]
MAFLRTSWHRPLVVFSAAMAVLAVVSAVGILVDDRVLVGAPIWAKPFKFAVSFVAYCLSLAWMLSLLPDRRRVGWWAGTVVALASLVEMVIITGQVVRGKRSHFNHQTPFDEALFNAMAVTVVILWAGTLVVAVLLLRARIADRASAWAMRSGILLALAGAAVGFLMTQPAPGQRRGVSKVVGAHSVGVPDGGPSMPLTGWSTTGGDLRIPHFFGMHALQLLPLLLMVLAVLAPRFARLADERVRLRLVLVASGAYAAVFGLVLWQALRGQPLIRPDGATLGAAGLILLAVTLGVYGALRTGRTSPPRGATAATGAPASKDLVS